MSIDQLKSFIPDSAKDIRLNLSKVLSDETGHLSPKQQWIVALASAHATRNTVVADNIQAAASGILDESDIQAAHGASAIMAMNNIYYRFLYLVNDPEYKTFPAGLRMQIIGNPGIPKIDFELACLAVSAINGCATCVESHAKTIETHGTSKLAIHAAIRIASVINAAGRVVVG